MEIILGITAFMWHTRLRLRLLLQHSGSSICPKGFGAAQDVNVNLIVVSVLLQWSYY